MWFHHDALPRPGGFVVSGELSRDQIARGDLFTVYTGRSKYVRCVIRRLNSQALIPEILNLTLSYKINFVLVE